MWQDLQNNYSSKLKYQSEYTVWVTEWVFLVANRCEDVFWVQEDGCESKAGTVLDT